MPTTPPNNQSVMQNQGPQSVLDIQQDILNNYRQSIRKPPRVSHPDGSPSFIATIKNDEHRMKTADLSIKNENLYGKRPNSKWKDPFHSPAAAAMQDLKIPVIGPILHLLTVVLVAVWELIKGLARGIFGKNKLDKFNKKIYKQNRKLVKKTLKVQDRQIKKAKKENNLLLKKKVKLNKINGKVDRLSGKKNTAKEKNLQQKKEIAQAKIKAKFLDKQQSIQRQINVAKEGKKSKKVALLESKLNTIKSKQEKVNSRVSDAWDKKITIASQQADAKAAKNKEKYNIGTHGGFTAGDFFAAGANARFEKTKKLKQKSDKLNNKYNHKLAKLNAKQDSQLEKLESKATEKYGKFTNQNKSVPTENKTPDSKTPSGKKQIQKNNPTREGVHKIQNESKQKRDAIKSQTKPISKPTITNDKPILKKPKVLDKKNDLGLNYGNSSKSKKKLKQKIK